MKGPDLYELLAKKVREIECELQLLNRWQGHPLTQDKFENMGAFGSNTMTFEQWIQFILIPRIDSIIKNKDKLPAESMLSTYAVRAFDGDPQATRLIELLCDVDNIVNAVPSDASNVGELSAKLPDQTAHSADTIYLDDEVVPQVLYSLADVLHRFEGEDLESQLQTFDIFLGILNPSTRPAIASLLQAAAVKAKAIARKRIERAASAVAEGGNASEP